MLAKTPGYRLRAFFRVVFLAAFFLLAGFFAAVARFLVVFFAAAFRRLFAISSPPFAVD